MSYVLDWGTSPSRHVLTRTSVPRTVFKCCGLLFSLSFAGVLGILLTGCGNEATGPSGGGVFDPFALWSSSGDKTYGQFYVTSSWNQRSQSPGYRSGGEIYAATDHDSLVSGGEMIASNLPMPQIAPGAYEDLRGINGPTFGSVSVWSLSGNSSAGIPAFADSMYVPAEIRITHPPVSTPAISRSQPLTVTWNADANNESILIVVDYMPDESRMRDSTLPGTKYRWTTLTNDDGSYTISASDLAGLPAGGIVQITLARGASKKSGTPSHPFHIYAYTVADVIHAVSQ